MPQQDLCVSIVSASFTNCTDFENAHIFITRFPTVRHRLCSGEVFFSTQTGSKARSIDRSKGLGRNEPLARLPKTQIRLRPGTDMASKILIFGTGSVGTVYGYIGMSQHLLSDAFLRATSEVSCCYDSHLVSFKLGRIALT